jgi:hypothetical protein
VTITGSSPVAQPAVQPSGLPLGCFPQHAGEPAAKRGLPLQTGVDQPNQTEEDPERILRAAVSANALQEPSALGLGVLRLNTCIYSAHEVDAARARASELWILSLPSSTTFSALVFGASANVS